MLFSSSFVFGFSGCSHDPTKLIYAGFLQQYLAYDKCPMSVSYHHHHYHHHHYKSILEALKEIPLWFHLSGALKTPQFIFVSFP